MKSEARGRDGGQWNIDRILLLKNTTEHQPVHGCSQGKP